MAETYNISEYMKENPAGPIGTIKFIPYATKLFDKTEPNPILLRVSSGRHMFWIERDDNFNLNYYHSSPGTDTRVASVDLNSIVISDTIFIIFTWSPDEIILNVGTSKKDGKVVSAKGKSSLVKFRVGEDSLIYRMEEENGVTHIITDYYRNGKYILQSTALEAWTETIKAIEILATGESTEGYTYEKVVSNLTLSVLVTGFESYTKKRFLELEQEGILPRMDMIIKEFYTKSERDADIPESAKIDAVSRGISELQHIIIKQNRVNFQSFKACMRAYNKGYNIRFSELGLSSEILEDIKKFIQYRHKIVHVSPLISMLNQEEVPSEKPVFPTIGTGERAKKCFIVFIDCLHKATLKLR